MAQPSSDGKKATNFLGKELTTLHPDSIISHEGGSCCLVLSGSEIVNNALLLNRTS